MVKEEKSKKVLQAEERLAQAKAMLAKAKQEERAKLRAEQNHHKYMMGGCIAKYFPECWEFSEQELNRIIACAFKNRDVQNMITLVVKERQADEQKIEESEVEVDAEDEEGNS